MAGSRRRSGCRVRRMDRAGIRAGARGDARACAVAPSLRGVTLAVELRRSVRAVLRCEGVVEGRVRDDHEQSRRQDRAATAIIVDQHDDGCLHPAAADSGAHHASRARSHLAESVRASTPSVGRSTLAAHRIRPRRADGVADPAVDEPTSRRARLGQGEVVGDQHDGLAVGVAARRAAPGRPGRRRCPARRSARRPAAAPAGSSAPGRPRPAAVRRRTAGPGRRRRAARCRASPAARSARRRASPRGSPASWAGSSTLSRTVRSSSRLKNWKTMPIRSRRYRAERGLAEPVDPHAVDGHACPRSAGPARRSG